MTFCNFFKNSIQPGDNFTGELTLSIRYSSSFELLTLMDGLNDNHNLSIYSSKEPSLVIYSMSQEDNEMVWVIFELIMILQDISPGEAAQ